MRLAVPCASSPLAVAANTARTSAGNTVGDYTTSGAPALGGASEAGLLSPEPPFHHVCPLLPPELATDGAVPDRGLLTAAMEGEGRRVIGLGHQQAEREAHRVVHANLRSRPAEREHARPAGRLPEASAQDDRARPVRIRRLDRDPEGAVREGVHDPVVDVRREK